MVGACRSHQVHQGRGQALQVLRGHQGIHLVDRSDSGREAGRREGIRQVEIDPAEGNLEVAVGAVQPPGELPGAATVVPV